MKKHQFNHVLESLDNSVKKDVAINKWNALKDSGKLMIYQYQEWLNLNNTNSIYLSSS